jgi:glycosyltransferase involved in cell wall biosynthesis
VLQDLNIPAEKIELVYNGIPPVKTSIAISKSLNIELNFAIIGQIVPWKGHMILVEAVEKLKKRGILNFKVLVYGNNATDFGIELKKKINIESLEKQFIWKGFVNNQEEVYEECDVVIVPSLSGEPCSLTIIESISRGKAVIVSDRGGNPELIEDNITGMVFNATDSSALADRMECLINNKSLITSLGLSAKQKAVINYSYLNMTDNYIKLYEKL